MKTLYITSKPPYPRIDGGCVASASFLDCLLSFSEVKHFTISTKKHPFSIDDFPVKNQKETQVESIEIDTSIKAIKAIKHLFNKKSYNVSRFDLPLIHNRLKELLNVNYDVVILDSLYSTPYLETIRSATNAKIYIRTHNVEYKVWQSLALNSSNILKRKYFSRLASDLKKYEIKTLNKANGILSLSNDDSIEFEKIGITTKTKLIPVTIKHIQQVANYSADSIFHLGAMNWEPNIEAVTNLLQIFSEVRKTKPSISLHIAGSNMNECPLDFDQENVVSEGFVKDLKSFVQKNGILVTPVYSGSGVRIKILEMMALGVPVITTKLGAQGITANKNLIIVDSHKEFVEKIIELSNDKYKREQLGLNSIAYIRENHSKAIVSKELFDFINET